MFPTCYAFYINEERTEQQWKPQTAFIASLNLWKLHRQNLQTATLVAMEMGRAGQSCTTSNTHRILISVHPSLFCAKSTKCYFYYLVMSAFWLKQRKIIHLLWITKLIWISLYLQYKVLIINTWHEKLHWQNTQTHLCRWACPHSTVGLPDNGEQWHPSRRPTWSLACTALLAVKRRREWERGGSPLSFHWGAEARDKYDLQRKGMIHRTKQFSEAAILVSVRDNGLGWDWKIEKHL